MRNKLRRLRREKGISQTFISKALGYKYPSGYANIEHGKSSLSLEQAMVIAKILDVEVDDLAEDNEDIFFKEKLHKKAKTTA